jgi:hypothetical protein
MTSPVNAEYPEFSKEYYVIGYRRPGHDFLGFSRSSVRPQLYENKKVAQNSAGSIGEVIKVKLVRVEE